MKLAKNIGAVIAGTMMFVTTSWAATTANVPETWNTGGLQNWTNFSENNSMTATNVTGVVLLRFGTVPFPNPPDITTGDFLSHSLSSSGMFTGDIAGVGATGISFKISCITGYVNNVCVVLEGASTRAWQYNITSLPTTGTTATITVPLVLSSSWIPRDSGYSNTDYDLFDQDIHNVKRVGVEIMRGAGNPNPHGIAIDDFNLMGPFMSGSAAYAGELAGNLIGVIADKGSNNPTASISGRSGLFRINDAPAPGSYVLKAYLDVNTNSITEFWEPQGKWSAGQVISFTNPLENAAITLADPETPDHVPYWWLVRNCGVGSESQALSKPGAEWIRGWAATNFVVRIVRLDNGQMALRWKHIPKQNFQLMAGDTPQTNTIEDVGGPITSANSTGMDENELIESSSSGNLQYYRMKLILP